MRTSFLAGALFTMALVAGLSLRDGTAAQGDEALGLWVGSSHITMSRATSDVTVGYTMQSDFWFRVDGAGNVRGTAYAVYQPTFDPAGLNGKITVAKSFVNGALTLFPGGQIAAARTAIDAGKGAVTLGVTGLIGVVGKYTATPIRKGAIVGTLQGRTLTLKWADSQPTGIPVTVALQYINKTVPLTKKTLPTQVPWHKPATIDGGSDGRLAVAQEQSNPPPKDGLTESMVAYWSATRVE